MNKLLPSRAFIPHGLLYYFNTPDNLGDPELEGNIYEAVTCRKSRELSIFAERIATFQRLIMIREERKTPQADYPAPFNFTQPLDELPDFGNSVAGLDDIEVMVIGNKL